MAAPRENAGRIKCVNNLKNIGLASRIYATDNADWLPFASTDPSAALKLSALDYFRALSNELSTPKIIICPRDVARKEARDWTNLALSNISYFANLNASETNPQSFLAGDRNLILNGRELSVGAYQVRTNDQLSWTKEIHGEQGNVVLADGGVQQFSNRRLIQSFRESAIATNLFLIP